MSKNVNNIFETYNPVSAYWAGFLAADGCIDTNNTISLELSEKDVEAVQQFKQDMSSEHDICFRESTKAYRIRFCRDDICESLRYNYSVTVDKTHNLELPLLPVEMYPHYLRGHFDGDGCFTEFFNNRPTASFRVFITSGSLDFLESVVELLIGLGVTTGRSIVKKAAKCWHIQYAIKDSTAFLNYIYCNNSTTNMRMLDRKYKKYLDVIVNGNRARQEIKV